MAKKRSDAIRSFGFIWQNRRLILPLLVLAVLMCGLTFVGVSDDARVIMMALVFMMLWLTTLFFMRQVMAKKKVRFRDGLYNAMTPLISSLMVFVILTIQCIPIMFVIIGYAAAVETNLFGNAFYGSLFVIFAILMIVISGYLLSGTLMGLIAVSAPGTYPIEALKLTHEVMIGRRVQFVLKMFIMLMVLILVWVIAVGPAVLVDLLLRNLAGVALPMLVPIFMMMATCFSVVYMAVYLYLYYREILEYE